MRALTMDGHEIDLKQDVLDTLARRLQGPLFAPGTAGYEPCKICEPELVDLRA